MVETCMNVLSSIPLYSFIKVGFTTKLPSGTFRHALLLFNYKNSIIAFQISPCRPFLTLSL